jgi:bacillithiol biosynthesis cysteine-adding enzyme BshC
MIPGLPPGPAHRCRYLVQRSHSEEQIEAERLETGKDCCIDSLRRGILRQERIPLSPHRLPARRPDRQENELLTADCFPITVAPGLHRLFLDYCSGARGAQPFYPLLPPDSAWQQRPPLPEHWPQLVRLLAAQNASPSPAAAAALDALRQGAGAVVTGQQVGLFGGPLFTPLKAATALARARQATAAGRPHAAIFWLATEDHDFAEINHVVFPARRELRKLVYSHAPAVPRPVGGIVLDETITPLIDQAWELLGASDAMDALARAYRPGRTFAQAFQEFYSQVFAAQGLLSIDASGRDAHRLGAPVLRAGIERADELHAALLDRNRALQAAGYHAQVAVGPQSSLLFLLDRSPDQSPGQSAGARLALRRQPATAREPGGLWQAGRQSYSTADLLGILEAEPERISPSALLRPVFQDFLLSTSATVGGPAEVAYFAQSAVLFERLLGENLSGRVTPVLARFSATLVEPAIGALLRQHELTLEQVFTGNPDSLAQYLAARSLPAEGRQKLAAAGSALEAELSPLVDWMRSHDESLHRPAETAASKMRYQMNRLRRLAANFQLQREASLARHAEAISHALYPDGVLQERLHGAAYYLARHGFALAEEVTRQAADNCPGHTELWL